VSLKPNNRGRAGISGVVGALILFVMLFTVGTTYFLWVNQNNAVYDQALASRNNANLALESESLSLVATAPGGTLSFAAQNTGALPVNMTNVFVVDSSGNVVCQKVLKQVTTPCPPVPQTAPIGVVINPGASQPTSANTGQAISPGSTYTIKVLTQRGNVFSAAYMGIGVATTLSATTIGAGSSVADTAAISGGNNPQGSVSFFYSTTNTCPTASATQVGGTGTTFPVIGGSATSSPVAFNSAGQDYWYATYNGDSNNPGGESSPCEPLSVVTAQPTLTTSVSPPVINIGSSATDTAYFSGGSPALAGTASFSVYKGAVCTGTPAFSDPSEPVAGNGAVPSKQFTAASVGTYTWQVSFTATDANDKSIPAQCGGTGETLTVNAATSSISTLLSDTTIVVGSSAYDTATLSSVTGNAGGSVQYSYFANGGCTGTPTPVGGPVAVTNGVPLKSGSQTFNTFGTYSWNAVYSGDLNNNAATSPCEPLTVQKVPSVSTTLLSPSIPVGGTVSDTATLSGATSGAGGTISFWWSLVNACPTTGATLFSSVPVSGNGIYPSVPSQPLSTPGVYYVYATYGGDANDAGVTSPCEPLTVGLAVTTQLSAGTITVGGSVSDSSILHFATGNAGGMVTYYWFSGSSCIGTATTVSTVTVTNGVIPPSSAAAFNTAGSYSWDAVYTGDANNQGPVTSPCEPLTVITSSGGQTGSLQQVIGSFKFYFTNCNPKGTTGSCSGSGHGLGDGVGVSGYYGYGLSFSTQSGCDQDEEGQNCSNPDVYQIALTNQDPSGRAISLSAQSFMMLQGVCLTADLCTGQDQDATFSQGYWIIDGICMPASTCNGGGAVPVPYSSAVTVGAGATVTLYFYCQGPCTSTSSENFQAPGVNPSPGTYLSVALNLYGLYSDGTPFGQAIPFTASYASPVQIVDCAAGSSYPGPSCWASSNPAQQLTGSPGSKITLSISGFPAQPTNPFPISVYWVSPTGTTSIINAPTTCDVNFQPCSVTFTIPSAAAPGLDALYVTSDGVNNVYATVNVFGATGITTTLSQTTIRVGGSVTDSATLSGVTGNAGGQVTYQFFSGSSCGGSATIVNPVVTVNNGIVPNSGSHTFNVVGSYSWDAVYTGDGNNAGSTSPCEPLTVSQATTTTTVTCSGVLCTATVTGFSGTITGETITWSKIGGTGSVTFPSGTTCALSAGGICSVPVKAATAGPVTIQASYPGDANNLASTGSASFTIVATTTSVSCVPTSFGVGSTSSCTATLTGFSGTVTGEAITWSQTGGTGTVTFSGGGTCTLSVGGTCVITVTGATRGTATVRAAYGGDANNAASSGTASLTVQAVTSTAVSCVPVSFAAATTTSCTATLTAFTAPVGGETITMSQTGGTGSVTFPSGTTCTLSALGTCAVTVNGATVGSPTIQASYPGDANNLASTGSTGITVTKATTTTTVSCVPNSFGVGATSSCTATLAGFSGIVTGETITMSKTGGTGSVTFPSGTTCALSAGGTSPVTVNGATLGPVTIQASYPGDANNLASTGSTSITVANKVASTTTVSCVPAKFANGRTTTCTATVTGQSPTGTITWSKLSGTGSVSFSPTTCTLSAGSCSTTVTGTGVGSPTIQASYGGDSSNLASTGSTTVTVGNAMNIVGQDQRDCTGANSCQSGNDPETSGYLLVVTISYYDSGSARTISSVSDGHNTFTQAVAATAVSGRLVSAIYYSVSTFTGNARVTVTLSGSAGTAFQTVISEFSGTYISGSVLGPTATGTCSNGGSCSSSLVTSSAVNYGTSSVLVGALTTHSGDQISGGSGFTEFSGSCSQTSNDGCGEYELPTTAGSTNFPASSNGNSDWADVGAVFLDPPTALPTTSNTSGGMSQANLGGIGQSLTPVIGIQAQLTALVSIWSYAGIKMNQSFRGVSNLDFNNLPSLLKRGRLR
jgi:hypothetical protein